MACLKKLALFFISGVLMCVPACLLAEDNTAITDSPFGVLEFLPWTHSWNNYHYDKVKTERVVRLMSQAGVSIVRMDFLWNDIEPSQGSFDFKKYDEIVDLLTSKNIEVLGLLSYNADWTRKAWNAPPDKDLFVVYASRTVRHFKGRVKYWEICNEPDEPRYWTPQDDMISYTALLKAVYPAIKKEDASAVVVLGGPSKTISVSIKKVYKYGGKDYFDIASFHPFVDPSLPNASQLLEGIYKGTYRVMAQNGDADKPIWFTEIGCPGIREPSNKSNGWWCGRSPTELEQAEWVKKVYSLPMRWKNVKKVFWAFFRDTPDHFKNGIDYFGLVREDFSTKPAYDAYRAVAGRRPEGDVSKRSEDKMDNTI